MAESLRRGPALGLLDTSTPRHLDAGAAPPHFPYGRTCSIGTSRGIDLARHVPEAALAAGPPDQKLLIRSC